MKWVTNLRHFSSGAGKAMVSEKFELLTTVEVINLIFFDLI